MSVELSSPVSVTLQTVTLTSSYSYNGSSKGTWAPPGQNIPPPPPAATVGKHQVKNLDSFPPKLIWSPR